MLALSAVLGMTCVLKCSCGLGGLRPVGVLQAPHPQSIARGLPTAELPSDHISLVADFVLYSGDRQSAPDAQKDGDPILVE